jgi:predicted ATPase/class 3 adenylate cyclase
MRVLRDTAAMKALPTGTVTFLFTDIEGSTRLVQALEDRYADVLADHCRIVRKAIVDAGGVEVSTQGDSFFAAFDSAPAALSATVEAQRALADHHWPDGVEVRVRMGLHTGEGLRGGDNYMGIDVHRAARIAGAGHGGQVLVSEATRSLVDFVPGAAFRDLGRHRLKDLANPEHLFQLDVAGLTSEFPALRSLDARPNNLPVQVTSFIGREKELAETGELLDRTRLVTLTGPGGTGKTRLALQVAAERLSRYADGAFFVELAAIDDERLVPTAIASAIGVRESADQPLMDRIKDALRDRELLLVLDNFEQVTDAAPLVIELLSAAPRLRVLTTSRALLHLRGEHEFPVPPLRIPDPSSLPSAEAISHYEGVALFIERAMAARTDFRVTNQSAPAIAEIVARLDGLPLAIELAAVKVRLFGPEAILARLGSRLAFLGGGTRDLPARQRTLRAAIDWSYGLLPSAEQALLRSLSVFAGGCSLEAIEAVCRPTALGLDGADGIEALVDQSLARREEGPHGEPRFTMLATIREYATERLGESGEADALRARHAAHFTAVAEAAEPELTRSPEAIERIGADHDNMRAALSWAIERDRAELGLRLGFALWRFWQQRGHLAEGREWFERLLALPGASTRTSARAKGLTGAAGIAYWQNDYSAAGAWYAEAEAIVRELDDRLWLTDALYNSASVAMLRGDVATAQAKFDEGNAIARELGDDAVIARYLAADGYMAFMTDDLARARALLEETLEIAERLDDRMSIGMSHHMVAQVARLDRRYATAVEHYREALRYGQALRDAASMTEPLQGLAAVAIATGDVERGVTLLGANEAIREKLGGGPPPEWLRLGDPLAEAREVLGTDAFKAAWEAGRELSVDDAVALALGPSTEAAGIGSEKGGTAWQVS